MDLYSILELQPICTENEIKKAYHRLALLYHPDKNKDLHATEKFQKISYAYEILINPKTRQEYCKLSGTDQNKFVSLLQKIFKNNLALDELKSFGINFEKNDWEYLQTNFYDLFNALNFEEIINFFKSGKFPKKKLDTTVYTISDTDNEVHNLFETYFNLPIHYQKFTKNDIIIKLDITLNDLSENNKRKIRIKRNIEDEQITNTFIFDIEKPYVVFPCCGDMDNGDFGNLIIKLQLANNFYWTENLIIYQQNINLYELIYGLTIGFKSGTTDISIPNWIPSRDGLFIEINNIKIKNYTFAVKLNLIYEDNEDKQQLIKNLLI
jgi:curved DNA-binding protein CbpA